MLKMEHLLLTSPQIYYQICFLRASVGEYYHSAVAQGRNSSVMLFFHHPHQLIRKSCLFYLCTSSDFHCLDYTRDNVLASRYSNAVQFLAVLFVQNSFSLPLKRPGSSLVSYICLPWIMSFIDMATISQSWGLQIWVSMSDIYCVSFVYLRGCSMQELSSLTRDQTCVLCSGIPQSLNPWFWGSLYAMF